MDQHGTANSVDDVIVAFRVDDVAVRECIGMGGEEPSGLSLAMLTRQFPTLWEMQRRELGMLSRSKTSYSS